MESDFVPKVRAMRFLQKKYFKTRDKSILSECKKAERDVDSELDLYLYGKKCIYEGGGLGLAPSVNPPKGVDVNSHSSVVNWLNKKD